MKRKILVVATKNWGKSIEDKYIQETKEILMAGDAITDVQIDIEYRKFARPDTYEDNEGANRITHDWFEENISNDAKARGYTSSRLRFEDNEGVKWKLGSGVRGINYRDTPNDFHGEGWIKTSRNKKARFKDGSIRAQWPKTLAHEEGHELKYSGFTDLEIHDYDYRDETNNIEEFYKKLVEKDNRPTIISELLKIINMLLQKLIGELALRASYIIPKNDFINGVTQEWLAPNKVYKSKHHNGLDLRWPIGGAIYAPHNGTIYQSGWTAQLGYYIFYECVIGDKKTYHVFPHLREEITLGARSKGDILGYIGNTGLSTGPHIHWGILRVKPVNVSHYVSLVDTKEKIIKNTYDPYKWMLYEADRIT